MRILLHCNHLAWCDPGPPLPLAGIPPLEAQQLQPIVLNHIVTQFPDRKWLRVGEAPAFMSCVMWLVDTMHFTVEEAAHHSDCYKDELHCWEPHNVQAFLRPYLELISKDPLCAASLLRHADADPKC